MTAWDERRTRAVFEAERAFDEDADVPRVTAVIAGWLEEVRLRRSTGGSDTRPSADAAAGELRGRLLGCGLEAWAGRLALLAEGTGPATDPGRILAELALGAGMGRLCGRVPDRASFELEEALSETLYDAWRGFPAAADRALQEIPDAQGALTGLLRAQVDDFTAAPRRMAWTSGVNTCAMAESHRRGPRLIDAWEGPRVRGLFRLRWPEAFEMLRRRDARAYLGVIEAFPHPEPARQALEAACQKAYPAVLAELLALAPPAFAGDGTWLTGAKTPFLLLGIAGDAICDAALGADDPGVARSRAEAVAGPVIGALLARPDAAYLGHAWAERLVQLAYRPHARQANRTTREIVPVLASVLGRLAAGVPPLDDPGAWLVWGDEIWRRDRVLAVAAPMLARPGNGNDRAAEFLVQAAERASLWITGVEGALSEDVMEARVAGTIVAGLQDPAGWFDRSWRRLAAARDRARHAVPDRVGGGHGGHVLLAWAACGLQRLPPGSTRAKALWVSLEGAVRLTRITEWYAGGAPAVLSHVHCHLAALWRTTFPEDPPATEAGSLEAFLCPFARPEDTLAELVITAWRSGVASDRLARAVPPSPGLGPLLRAVVEDRALRRRPAWTGHGMRAEFDVRLHALLKSLGCHTGG